MARKPLEPVMVIQDLPKEKASIPLEMVNFKFDPKQFSKLDENFLGISKSEAYNSLTQENINYLVSLKQTLDMLSKKRNFKNAKMEDKKLDSVRSFAQNEILDESIKDFLEAQKIVNKWQTLFSLKGMDNKKTKIVSLLNSKRKSAKEDTKEIYPIEINGMYFSAKFKERENKEAALLINLRSKGTTLEFEPKRDKHYLTISYNLRSITTPKYQIFMGEDGVSIKNVLKGQDLNSQTNTHFIERAYEMGANTLNIFQNCLFEGENLEMFDSKYVFEKPDGKLVYFSKKSLPEGEKEFEFQKGLGWVSIEE